MSPVRMSKVRMGKAGMSKVRMGKAGIGEARDSDVPPRVRLTDVVVRYNGHNAVDHVDLDVAAGEWVAIIGPNGAGKSSLLRAVAGLVGLVSGVVAIDGTAVSELKPRDLARRIALVPQEPELPAPMSALDYVLLGRTPHLGYWAMEGPADVDVAMRALVALGAGDLAARPLGRLSGGERRRVVLARAIAQDASVLLLDEPTTALDIGHQQHVLDLVEELRRSRAIAVVSAVHDLTLAAQYADRLALLDDGALVADGPADEVLTTERLERFSGARVAVMRGPDGAIVVVPVRPGQGS